jgi:hypothetical protein
MNPTFKNNELQQQFEKNGFVKVRLLSAEKAKELRDFYLTTAQEHNVVDTAYHTTSHTGNPELIKKVNVKFRDLMTEATAEHLDNFKPFICNFLVKEPDEDSTLLFHQDWCFVDEREYMSLNVWVALEDVGEKNGSMKFIPGSHKWMPTVRPAPTYPWAYELVKDKLEDYAITIPALAGEGFIFSHSTVHASAANLSNEVRVAGVLGIYSADAQLSYYFRDPERGTAVEVYQMHYEDFYSLKHHGRPDQSKYVRTFNFEFPQMAPSQLPPNPKAPLQKSWLKRLQSYFSR